MVKRILCVLGKLRAGGVESIMYSYYRFIDKSKYQFDFVYEEASDFNVPAELLEMGASAFKVPNVESPFKYIKELKRIINQGNYDTVHSNLNTLSVFSLFAAKMCGVKYRILHNHTTSSPVEKKRTLLKKILRPFNCALMNKPCACSELAGRWMYGDRAISQGKVRILRNGVDTELFKFSESSRDEIRREFGIDNKKVIGHVGRFVTTKNHLFIIDVFSEYIKNDPDAVLVLVGDGELFENVKEYTKQKNIADKVVFAGVRDDVNKFFSAFDVFVLPSLYEGLPIVAMEACASGLPVLLSDKITRECAVLDTVSFLPIDSTDPWVKGIKAAKASDRAAAADIMARGPYNIKNCVKDLEELYAECS